MSVQFRPAAPGDAEGVAALHADSWRLHVTNDRRRSGIGTQLLPQAATTVLTDAASPAMYMWVLEQNADAQRFYRAEGAVNTERAFVSPPGGDPARLNGTPAKLRMAWPDVTALAGTLTAG